MGQISSSIYVIDADKGKTVGTISLKPDVDAIWAFKNKLYITHGPKAKNDYSDISIYDPAHTNNIKTIEVKGYWGKNVLLISNDVCIILKNNVEQKIYFYNIDQQEYINFNFVRSKGAL